MIIVDGREIKVSETREATLKVIIDAIEKGFLTDCQINSIQLACLFGACNTMVKKGDKE